MSSSFGHFFRITTFGESHGGGVGVVIDGCPPGHKIDMKKVQQQLARRKPGQSHLTTPRAEDDMVECLSGMVDNVTLGTPIALVVRNKDFRKHDYSDLNKTYRPSHADYTNDAKYGLQAPSGGGRSSARETIGRVAAAAVAEQVMAELIPGFKVVAWVDSVKQIHATVPDPTGLSREDVDQNLLRCPDPNAVQRMEEIIVSAQKNGDSVGGTIYCGANGVLPGLGEPIFDKLEADLAKAVMSLPASKGFEIGSGFQATQMFGSEHNDEFIITDKGAVGTATNRSGGVQGGISNGEFVYLRVAFKPVSTIFKEQRSVDRQGQEVAMKPKSGRHDPCVLPRAVPMVEAMVTLVLVDHYLRQLPLEHARGSMRL